MVYRGSISNFIEWNIFFFGGYELKEAALMADILQYTPDAVSFDVGANLGNHAFMLSKFCHEVHAFEPFGPLADRIEDQIARNHIQNIKVHRFGLGEHDEKGRYFLDMSSPNSGTGSFISEHTGADAVAELLIRRADDWIHDARPELIKIDVEGFEAPVLKGMRNILNRACPFVLMEVTETSWKEFRKYGDISFFFPYEISLFEVVNPRYPFLLFQDGHYRLKPILSLKPRSASFNVLIVPEDRMSILNELPIISE
jgi:FkbM family methyltransferase